MTASRQIVLVVTVLNGSLPRIATRMDLQFPTLWKDNSGIGGNHVTILS